MCSFGEGASIHRWAEDIVMSDGSFRILPFFSKRSPDTETVAVSMWDSTSFAFIVLQVLLGFDLVSFTSSLELQAVIYPEICCLQTESQLSVTVGEISVRIN